MTPKDDVPQDPLAIRQRPVRLPSSMWDDFDRVAKVMDADGNTIFREYVRWITGDETARLPRLPDTRPTGPWYVPLPPQIRVIHEFDAGSPYRSTPRFVLRIDAPLEAVLKALDDGGAAAGASYIDTEPLQMSTLDRSHAERMLAVFTEAELPVLE